MFPFNNIFYEKNDGINMGSLLGSVMVNIIATELENKVIKPFMNNGTTKFYCHYADDTLIIVKPQDVSRIYELLNSFDKDVKFTTDLFENEFHHLLDLKMSPHGISIYRKDTNTALYVNYIRFSPCTPLIRSLVIRALKNMF